MSAQAHLLELYQQWRKFTETEREAIAEGDWRRVKSCQKSKGELQPRILKQTEETQLEWSRLGVDRKEMEKELRSVVNELIFLETSNVELLAERRKAAGEELEKLNQSRKNLSKIHKHYASGPPVNWESYS